MTSAAVPVSERALSALTLRSQTLRQRWEDAVVAREDAERRHAAAIADQRVAERELVAIRGRIEALRARLEQERSALKKLSTADRGTARSETAVTSWLSVASKAATAESGSDSASAAPAHLLHLSRRAPLQPSQAPTIASRPLSPPPALVPALAPVAAVVAAEAGRRAAPPVLLLPHAKRFRIGSNGTMLPSAWSYGAHQSTVRTDAADAAPAAAAVRMGAEGAGAGLEAGDAGSDGGQDATGGTARCSGLDTSADAAPLCRYELMPNGVCNDPTRVAQHFRDFAVGARRRDMDGVSRASRGDSARSRQQCRWRT